MMSLNNSQINPREDVGTTLFVCVTCGRMPDQASIKSPVGTGTGAGERLADVLIEKFATKLLAVRVQKVQCLGGCQHPCAVAVAAPGKITYMYGDLPVTVDMAGVVDQIETYMRQYTASLNGYVPPLDKPTLFQPVLVRIPDPAWVSETGRVTPAIHGAYAADTSTHVKAEGDDAPPFASPLRRADDDA